MNFLSDITTHYGWQGIALAAVILTMLCVQLYYYLYLYGSVPSYKVASRRQRLPEAPPVSIIIPMFGEDYAFLEDRLPLLLAQVGINYQLVIVYVGNDGDFFEDLSRIKKRFPQLSTTKIEFNPRFPISTKMALNVGIKAAHYDHIVCSSPDAAPASDRWISLVSKGFMRADVVLCYCGLERLPGLKNRIMRADRMMRSTEWIASAIHGRPYRGIRHAIGFTKSLYYGVNGFGFLDMNIGEEDLFLQRIATASNTAVVLSPRATLRERSWGGWRWIIGQRRLYGSTFAFYPRSVKNYVHWERGSRVLFFAAVACALVTMPLEYKIGAAVLTLLRYGIVANVVRRIALRLGEPGIWSIYLIHDLLGPVQEFLVAVLHLKKDPRVWR